AATDARAAAVGDGSDASAVAKIEHADDVLLVAREGHEIRRRVEVASQTTHDIAIRLTIRVPGAIVRSVAEECRELIRLFHPRRRKAKRVEPRGLDGRSVDPLEGLGKRIARGAELELVGPLAFVPPPPKAPRSHRYPSLSRCAALSLWRALSVSM